MQIIQNFTENQELIDGIEMGFEEVQIAIGEFIQILKSSGESTEDSGKNT